MKKPILTFHHHENPTTENYAQSDELRPVELLEDEKQVWDRIMPYLAKLDRLKPWYLDTLAEYCKVVAAMKRITLHLRVEGETYSSATRNGLQIKMRPEVGQLNELRRMLRSYVGDFGLTPAAEKQLTGMQRDWLEENNPFVELEKESITHGSGYTLQ